MNMNRIKTLCLTRAGREQLATEMSDIMEAGTAPPAGFDTALAYVVASIRQHDADGRALFDGRSMEEWQRLLDDPDAEAIHSEFVKAASLPKRNTRSTGIDAAAIYAKRNKQPATERDRFVAAGTVAMLARVR